MQNLSWFRRWNEHFLFDLRKYFLKKVKFSVFFLLKDEINKVPHSKKVYEIRSDDGTDPLYGRFVKCFIVKVLDQLWFETIPNKNGQNVRKVLFPVKFWIISITRVLEILSNNFNEFRLGIRESLLISGYHISLKK